MIVLHGIVFTAALLAVALLLAWQTQVFLQEYRFYRANGWDFSVDSALDRIDRRITAYPLPFTNRQRLFLFRPFYFAMLVLFLAGMVASLF